MNDIDFDLEDLDILEILGVEEQKIESLSIISGFNKIGEKENFDRIEIKAGEIVAIVGPTGSGKSRLLADIEWGAQADTPTKRTILINNELMDKERDFLQVIS